MFNQLTGIGVSIICDGVPTPEYDIQEKQRTSKCFITSEANQQFIIAYKSCLPYAALALRILFDGAHLDTWIALPGGGVIPGARADRNSMRPFEFTAIQTTDDDDAQFDGSRLSSVGIIEVTAYRVEIVQSTQSNDIPNWSPVSLVHERTKKSGSNCVNLGSAQVFPYETLGFECIHIDLIDRPYARFTFLYRPQGILNALGLIARSVVSDCTKYSRGSVVKDIKHRRTTNPGDASCDLVAVKKQENDDSTANTQK